MKDKTFLEKTFLITGAIFLLIGLFIFIDLSSISKYLISGGLVTGTIASYIFALKFKGEYSKTSSILAFVSWGLSIGTLYYLSSMFSLGQAQYLIPLIVGIYSLFLIKDFHNEPFILIMTLWSVVLGSAYDSWAIIDVACYLFALYFIYKLINLYMNNYNVNNFVVFIQANVLFCIPARLVTDLFMKYDIYLDYEPMILVYIITLLATLNIKSFTENKCFKTTNIFYLCATSCYLSSSYFWEGIVDSNLAVFLTIVSFAFILALLIKMTLNGGKLSFALIFIHIIIFFSTTILEYVSTAVFLMLLGLTLMGIGYWLEKTRVKKTNIEE